MRTILEADIKRLSSLGVHIESLRPGQSCHVEIRFEPPAQISKQVRWDLPLAVGAFTMVHGPGIISFAEIGRYCSVAPNVTIGSNEHAMSWLSTASIFEDPEALGWRSKLQVQGNAIPNPRSFHGSISKTNIGNDVWIGHGAFVRGGVSIGDGAVIGAMSNVISDVPPYAIFAGNPARLIRYRFDHETIIELLKFKWWQYSVFDMNGVNVENPISAISQIRNLNLEPYLPDWVALKKE